MTETVLNAELKRGDESLRSAEETSGVGIAMLQT
jgi:hypothetical protein